MNSRLRTEMLHMSLDDPQLAPASAKPGPAAPSWEPAPSPTAAAGPLRGGDAAPGIAPGRADQSRAHGVHTGDASIISYASDTEDLAPPQTPQTQQLPRWASPTLDSTLPSFADSPLSPSSPDMPMSPILPIADAPVRVAGAEFAPLRMPSRQSSLRRTGSKRSSPQARVGELAIGKQIGQGSFSQTYQAYTSTEIYAVKVRLPSTNPALFAHEREVLELLARSHRPGRAGSDNVVKFYPELSETDHFVFKLYDSSLDQVVRSPQFQVDPDSLDFFDFRVMSQPLVGMATWVDWSQQLKDGLEFIHQQNVVHADIKPDNVLISTASNQLVIADFSGAIAISMQPASVLAQDLIEGFAWSPVYTDPLVRKQATLPSFGSDIYALGLVLAFMATGMEPYCSAKNATQRLLWMDKIKPLDSFDPDVAPRLSKVRHVINLCLNRSFQGFDEALAALREQSQSSP